MNSAYLFIIGYLIAAGALFVFSLRMRRVYLLERSKIFQFIYVGCALLGLSLLFYAACYLVTDRVQLTALNELADATLFAGLFTVARFPATFWGGTLNLPRFSRWAQRLLLLAIVVVLGEGIIELVYGIRPLCELVGGTTFVDHAPIYYNIVKVAVILLAGVGAGLTNVYFGATQHSLRSYLLGFGMVITTTGGAITVFSFDDRTGPIGAVVYLLGGSILVAGVLTKRKEDSSQAPSAPA